MKWLIGPRRVGKSRKLLQELMNFSGDAVLIGFNRASLKHIYFYMVRELYPEALINEKNMTIKFNGYTKYFKTFKYLRDNSKSEIKSLPKFIDEAGYFLEEEFSNVKYISGTGPNFEWDIRFSKEQMDKIKEIVDEETFLNEHTSKW